MDDPKQKTAIYSTCDYCGRWFRMRRWRVHLGAVVLNKQGMDYVAYCGCELPEWHRAIPGWA
jgi:hypothetical protein